MSQSTSIPQTSTPSPSPSTSPNQLNNTSSLLFGFLVSVLSLFGIFMVSGLIWHRLVLRRRAIEAMALVGSQSRSRGMRRPSLWEVWLNPEKDPLLWENAKPLSGVNCEVPSEQDCCSDQLPPSSISTWKQRVLRHIAPEIVYLFSRPSPLPIVSSTDDLEPSLPLPGSDIQLSLLIAMPRRSGFGAEMERKEGLHEVVIGTTDVLYRDSDFDKDQ
ncbi:hypothetical protein BJ138DRAFT_1153637 [Hygrophoropsis aurantiaca]|uniref:Uncharacterized protein n=1 Tax=Hygrophoropsis aurantiaca TaxID=72124 RepID=A0ACB8AA60_9AGAM|nr:hypothetical protein BJ138DRAFT_1153637 [Hygrophoropsis aurantiaca]